MHRILVTGGTGFIGRALAGRLRDEAGTLRILTRKATAAPPGCEAVLASLDDEASLRAACSGADILYHLAGHAHVTNRHAAGEAELHRRINFEATCRLYRVAAQTGLRRFVFVSSVKAGGESAMRCLDENSDLLPDDPYGQAKRRAEDWLLEQARAGGPEVVIIRPTLVYGPGVKGNLAAMLRWIDRGIFPPVPETGNRRSMVDVRDLVEALLAAGSRPEAVGQIYIISDSEDYSTRRIYEAMCRALGRRPLPGLPAALLRGLGRIGDLLEGVLRRPLPYNGATASRLLDSACYRSVRAERLLGFRPRYRLEDALPQMVATYRGATSASAGVD
ncbi:NAD-dependent epimerase/dehydratase family protein [Thiohalobacter sp. IOR34]|uniref:NAD-dependent epimerase/dehydratase family protein n=1 Tax=Thiohalobacter sp. IOR34 TaxID=3057176 RepID=UPI0025B09ABA|nr:NAD-dependent epimerase/dehydratase family protein [Thiohalobacter sp. IOR34]WJW76716.1 NAD-dependent epimerase/dehydratase family protein [Thiohalobacter sp. IOR34]